MFVLVILCPYGTAVHGIREEYGFSHRCGLTCRFDVQFANFLSQVLNGNFQLARCSRPVACAFLKRRRNECTFKLGDFLLQGFFYKIVGYFVFHVQEFLAQRPRSRRDHIFFDCLYPVNSVPYGTECGFITFFLMSNIASLAGQDCYAGAGCLSHEIGVRVECLYTTHAPEASPARSDFAQKPKAMCESTRSKIQSAGINN